MSSQHISFAKTLKRYFKAAVTGDCNLLPGMAESRNRRSRSVGHLDEQLGQPPSMNGNIAPALASQAPPNNGDATDKTGKAPLKAKGVTCVPTCKIRNKKISTVQCHLCQIWVHPACVNEKDADIIGLWTCHACRKLPGMVSTLLETVKHQTPLLADVSRCVKEMHSIAPEIQAVANKLVAKTEAYNALVIENSILRDKVSHLTEQASKTQDTLRELHNLRADVTRGHLYADLSRTKPAGTTLVVGNSLLRDVHTETTTDGHSIKIVKKSGATLKKLLIEEATRRGDVLRKIVIVGGTRELTDNVSAERINEQLSALVRKAKAATASVTFSSVLPVLKRADMQHLEDINRQMKEICDELQVQFVDNDSNFTFRDGTVDSAAYLKDGLHLSESGVNRLMSNLGLPERQPRQPTQQQQQQQHQQQKHQQQKQHRQQQRQQPQQPNADNTSHRGHRASTGNDDDGNWELIERKHSHQRRTLGQCSKCGESNHVTATCRHTHRVECRQCGQLGHKDKHHAGR